MAASEAEGGSDIDRLAVAALVGERLEPVVLDPVADAAGDVEIAGQAIGTADADSVADILGDDACLVRSARSTAAWTRPVNFSPL